MARGQLQEEARLRIQVTKLRKGIQERDVRLLEREARIALLEEVVATHERTITDLKLQMEELRTIVVGRKRTKENDFDDTPPAHKIPRTPDSYKRPLPKESEITNTQNHPLDACTTCQGSFCGRETVTYFEEDIPLPQQKIIIKHTIEKGYCEVCKHWSTSIPLPTAPVVLGGAVKRYVTYLSVVCRQSYAQIQDLLIQMYDFSLSQGEIAKIMEKEGARLRPEYERLKVRLRSELSVHLDETIWDLILGDGYRRYAWTMVGGTSKESVFILGKTRGKGNADDLLGDSRAVVVSDDYAAYRTLNGPHQLCCAHILRKLRDLARSGEIEGRAHDHCVAAYHTFAAIYGEVEVARTSSRPTTSHDAVLKRLRVFATIRSFDVTKLVRIKNQVSERAQEYLTCLVHPGVASDNNAAERSLRHLVLKRKISFGSFSEKTAETLAILLSVLMSYKQRGTLRVYLQGV